MQSRNRPGVAGHVWLPVGLAGTVRRIACSTGVLVGVLAAAFGVSSASAQQRGYEMVTPPDDLLYDVVLRWDDSSSAGGAEGGAGFRVSPDGSRVAWRTDGDIPGIAVDGELIDDFIATREADRWVSSAPLGDRSGVGCGFSGGSPFLHAFSPDGSRMLLGFGCQADRTRFGGVDPTTEQPLDQTLLGASRALYTVDVASDSVELLSPRLGPSGPISRTDSNVDRYFGGSDDLSVVYFASGAALLDGMADLGATIPAIYRVEDGETSLLTRTATGEPFGLRQITPTPFDRPNAVSADAETVTFTGPGSTNATFNKPMVEEDTNTVHDVYQVRDGLVSWISNPAAVPVDDRPAEPQTAANRLFHGASADGERVFFATTERMTADDTDTALDIYMSDGGAIERVSKQDGGTCAGCDDNASSTTGISHSNANYVVNSDDGSRLFLVTGDVLAEDDTDAQPSLYVRDIDGGETTYIAPAGAGVTSATNGADAGTNTAGSLVRLVATPTPSFRDRPIEISADGRTAVFSLQTNVTLPVGRGGVDADGARDLFVWREGVGLRRVRQGPGVDDNTATVPAHGCYAWPSRPPCRALAASDSTVFFETADALVDEDTDGGRTDVYGVSVETGEVELITPPGDAPFDSRYVDSSEDGEAVFFSTSEQVDPSRDRDSGRPDVYVSRTGEVLPPLEDPSGECVDDACQAPPSGGAAPPPIAPPGKDDDNARPGARATYSVGRLAAPQRARLARGQRVAIRVRVSQAGRVAIRLRARVRGKTRTVGSVTRRVAKASTARAGVRLSRAGRRELARRGRLAVEVEVRFADRPPSTFTVRLRAPRGGSR